MGVKFKGRGVGANVIDRGWAVAEYLEELVFP
jgi:hypothetical protein